MSPKSRLLLEMSEKRQRLNELLETDPAQQTDELRSERDVLTARLQALEPELRAAIVLEESAEVRVVGTSEHRAYDELVTRCNIGEVFQATVEHRGTGGAERELQQHHHLQEHAIPLALLEDRAATPAPSDVAQNQASIVPGVFPQACASFLGVDMPRVGVGDAVFPILGTSAIAGVPAEGAVPTGTGVGSLGETTGSFTADVLTPKRIQAAFFFSREDRARFAGMAEALRENLSMALGDKLDQQILAGTNGLFIGTNLPDHDVSAITDFAAYKSAFAFSRVDGQWASSVGELRVLLGSATYSHCAITYRSSGSNADSTDAALDVLMGKTGGVKVSSHVPAAASNKQNNVIRLGMRRDMVAPIWEGIELITDEITKASTGEIVITAIMMHNVKVLRSGGFYKQEAKVA